MNDSIKKLLLQIQGNGGLWFLSEIT